MRTAGAEHHHDDHHYDDHRNEEFAQIVPGIHIIADIHTPRQLLRLRHMTDVAVLHRLVFRVFPRTNPLLGGLRTRLTILGNKRTQVLRLCFLAFGGRTPLALSGFRA